MAKKKYSKKYEIWGGRELKAIINGKLTGVKYDKGTRSYFWREPQPTGRAQKRNLSRNKGKAAQQWWDIVEQHQREQLQPLPANKIKTHKKIKFVQQPDQSEEVFDALVEQAHRLLSKGEDETVEEWKERVWDNPRLLQFVDNIEYFIPENVLAVIFNKWLEDPYECSKKLGREDIANLHKLSAREPISLSKLPSYYFDYIPTDRPQASEKERKKVKKWFEQFIRIANKTYLDDLNKSDIEHYTQTILRLADKDERSSTWIAHRFGAVRTVINIFARSLEDKILTSTIIAWLKDFPAPSTRSNGNGEVFNAKPLTKKQWKELLSVVMNDKWSAIVLFALNTCSYGVDCRDVMMKHISLEQKHLTMFRKKKGAVPKCAVLWDETVRAIKKFRKGKIAKSAYLFPSSYGSQYTEGGFYDYWSKRIKPKVSWDFDFNQIRDAGRYGAEKGGASPNHIRIAMGHRIKGIDDAYLFRHPELVEDVSEAIHDYYFGKQKE